MRTRTVLLAAAAVLASVAVILALRNVEVRVDERDLDGTTGAVGCVVAPWDAAVHDERRGPGGEHAPAWGEAVGAACARENDQRFAAAVTTGAIAILLVAGASMASRSGRRVDSVG